MQSPAVNQAMEILREMRQITGGQASVQEKLEQIVALIAVKMSADAANCYVAVDDYTLELFASYGFKPGVAHKVYMRFGEGLVGEVAQNNPFAGNCRCLVSPQVFLQAGFGRRKL